MSAPAFNPDSEANPLFELRAPDGHVWRLYADGQIDGFPKGTTIINRAMPLLNALKSAGSLNNHESTS